MDIDTELNEDALQMLAPREEICILLYYKEHKSIADIAKEFGADFDVIKQVIDTAIRKLRHPKHKGKRATTKNIW